MSRFEPEFALETAIARAGIRAYSRRQAMDWSLVLASQGIETMIENNPTGGWELVVAGSDREAAVAAIRQYRVENRGWPWQHPVGETGVVFDWGCLAWSFLLALFFQLQAGGGLVPSGMMDSVEVAHGAWWRLFTAIWLHADLAHFCANVTLGTVLLGLVMGRFGTGQGALAAYLAGAGGNVVAWLAATEPHHSLGASGMVMGSLGLLAVPAMSMWRGQARGLKYLLSGLGGGVMLFMLVGLAPGTDVVAHVGGFVSGLALGGLLVLIPNWAQNSKGNLAAGLLFASLVIGPWWLALSKNH